MGEILINCDNKKKTIAIIENGVLVEKYEETPISKRIEENIYLGKITDILPGMQAAFVDIGEGTNAFLHIKDILPKVSNETGNKEEEYSKYNIKSFIKVGMPILVQVKKDKTEKKGARVSTHLNIAGRYTVLMPNLNFVTVSQKIEDKQEVERLKQIIEKINTENHGIIVRTAAIEKTEEVISQDINNLISLYKKIKNSYEQLLKSHEVKPQIIYENGGIINKILIDLIDKSINKIIVNSQCEFDYVYKILSNMNVNESILQIHDSVLQMYDLNNQMEKIKNRKVWLKCGGFITIDKTEALTAIDVNTGKFTGNGNLEQTVLKVNKEATTEIAKQLKLRDIGGIIIIDYIDMEDKQHEEMIIELLNKELKKDRAKTQVIGFSKLHLVEMTRKHIFSSLE